MDFEHAIKMDVRNNPIVRELDQARQRELWRWMLVGGALVGVILFSLWQRFSVMRVATQIESTERELGQAREAQRRLRLDVERLSAPRRIEELALRARMIHAAPAPTITTEISCASVSPSTTPSLRRMNSIRNRSSPASTAHRANRLPGRRRWRRRHSTTVTIPITIVS